MALGPPSLAATIVRAQDRPGGVLSERVAGTEARMGEVNRISLAPCGPFSYGLCSYGTSSYGLYSHGTSNYVVMAYIVMPYICMAYIVMAHTVTAYIVMAHTVMPYIVMPYVVMPCIGMAYIVVACRISFVPPNALGMTYDWSTVFASPSIRSNLFMADIVMACVIMACIVMAYLASGRTSSPPHQGSRCCRCRCRR